MKKKQRNSITELGSFKWENHFGFRLWVREYPVRTDQTDRTNDCRMKII